MDPQPDVIRQQIEDTRSSLTEKLETLEAEVKGTVQSAKDTVESAKESVQETIDSVKETVHDATESVKRNLDLHYQVDQHPWAMMGLSLVSGAIAGALLGSRMSPDRRLARRMAEASREAPLHHEAAPSGARSSLTHEGPARLGFMDRLAGQLGEEVEKAKDLAIKTVVAVVDDVIKRSIPVLGSAVEDMVSRAATNFSAPPQHGDERREQFAGAGYQTPPMY
jgi:ElaB/YqjD/DUF883 family membrane-anchored ribosome-binding protein